ncbi:hypothetical protein AB0E08_39010 [Streptomyces sp. NPDC048281]|uniref:hypothetical protein n=1 Tax=Streptomyces sp. NPDC048281 TaxID=3154715 RepID=UPI003448D056
MSTWTASPTDSDARRRQERAVACSMTMRLSRQYLSFSLRDRGSESAVCAVSAKCGTAWLDRVTADARWARTALPARFWLEVVRAKSAVSWTTSRARACASVTCRSSAVKDGGAGT